MEQTLPMMDELMTIIILIGVPGSGKSTLLAETLKSCPTLTVVNYGDMMIAEALLQNVDRDALRKLPLSQQREIGLAAAKKIAKMPGIILVDTHAFIKTPLGYYPGVPEQVVKILNPKVMAMIECPSSTIYERRQKDPTRNRDQESVDQIEYHQQISRTFAIACAAISGALFTAISTQKSPSDAAQGLIQLVQYDSPKSSP